VKPFIIAAFAAVAFLFLRGRGAAAASLAPTSAGDDLEAQGAGEAAQSMTGYQSAREDFAQAIAQFEGSGVGRNNPGNIKAVSSGYPGQVSTDGKGFAIGGDVGDGWGWLDDYIQQHAQAHPDWDFYDFFGNYLRGSTTAPTADAEGNSDSYASYVANYMGTDPTASVAGVLGFNS
jgi:hypothetical protein